MHVIARTRDDGAGRTDQGPWTPQRRHRAGPLPEATPVVTTRSGTRTGARHVARAAGARRHPHEPGTTTTSPTPEAVAPPLRAKLGAEVFGTFVLVLFGCGTAVIAADEVGFLGVALAFGLAVLAAAYAVGGVSGGHFNPAVTVGLAVARRFAWRDVPGYAAAQVVGGSLAAVVLYVVASGRDGFTTADGFATNGYGDLSPAGYTLLAAAVVEVILTALFVMVILGVTDRRAPAGFGPMAIGLTLTAIHLVSIPVTNTSVNPARSLAVAWFDADALGQVWLFVAAPLAGAVLAGVAYTALLAARRD